MKIKDIISVPDVETVIQLTKVIDETDKTKLATLVKTFVVTDDIFKNFNKLFQPIIKNEGAGYFLKGSYGSGKSHFLSVISLLFKYHDMWDFIIKQNNSLSDIKSELLHKKYFVVNVPMLLYREEEKLEQALLKSIEMELSKQDININLSDAKKIVDDFFQYTSTSVQKNFKEYLASINVNDFEKVSIEQQASIIKKFIFYSNIPFTFTYNRATVFDQFIQLVRNYNYTGIIILVDELSEFLSSKHSNSALDEDIRFLQFLGEFTANNPIWIVCAIQEEIKDISHISNKIFTKIKDRYKNRLELTNLHIEELIDKRLIIKNKEKKEILQKLYNRIISHFQFLKLDFRRFYALYPLINPTIVLLQSITNIFSKQRGIVDFIHYQIKGDEKRGIKGILDEDYSTLITPDKIFDHFEHNIQEFIDTNPYYEKVYKYYRQNIPTIFRSKDEQTLALRLIKILILLQIAPSISPQSVKSLTHMLMCVYSDTESMLNYEYIYNNIIKLFINKMDYVTEQQKESFLENVISINISININQILNNKFNLHNSRLEGKENLIIENILKLTPIKFLDTENWLDNIVEKKAIFQNTQRIGYVIIDNLKKFDSNTLDEYYNKVKKDDKDFFIIIGMPDTTDVYARIKNIFRSYDNKKQKIFLIWCPETLTEEEFSISRQAYVYNKLLEEYDKDSSSQAKQIKKTVKNKLEVLLTNAQTIFSEKYINGKLIVYEEEITANFKIIGKNKDEIIETLGDTILKKRYPLHHEIKPDTSYYNIIQITNCVKTFFHSGEISSTEVDINGIRNIVDGILLPLRLIQKKERKYFLKPMPEKSKFLLEYLSYLTKEGKNFTELYQTFRENEYGITRILFLLVTIALSAAGMIVAKKNNRTVPFDKINLSDLDSIDTLFPGEIIDSDVRDKISQIDFVKENFKDGVVTLYSQNKVWDEIVDLKKNVYPKFVDMESNLKTYENYSFFKNSDVIKKIQNKLKYCIDIFNSIKTSYNSKEGLEQFINSIDNINYLNEAFFYINNCISFFQNNINSYLLFVNYLKNVIIPAEYTELKQLKDELQNELSNFNSVLNSNFNDIQNQFYSFQEKYINVYIEEHKKYYEDIPFDKIIDLRKRDTYILLDRLSKLKYISIDNDILNIEKRINFYIQKRCKSVNIEKLKGTATPQCDCGYILGAKPFIIDIDEILKLLKKGILEYITELQNEEYIEKLSLHITGLRQINKKVVADSIEKLLKINVDTDFNKLLVQLKSLITLEVIDEINKAFEGETVVIKRDINKFIDKIVNKNMSKNKLYKLFNDWITDFGKVKVDDNTFIDIYDLKNLDMPDTLKERLKKIFETEDFASSLKLLLLVNWFISHKLEIEKNILFLTGTKLKQNTITELIEIYNENKDNIMPDKFNTDNEIDKLIDILNLDERSFDEMIILLNEENIFSRVKVEIARRMINNIIDEKIGSDWIKINESANLLPEINENIRYISILNDINQHIESNIKFKDLLDWVNNIYKEHLSRVDFLITKFSKFSNRFEIISSEKFNNFRRNLEKSVKKQEEIFTELFKKEKELPTPANWHKKIENGGVVFIFDGMRCDLWRYFKEILMEYNIEVKKEEYMFAIPPTETLRQRYALFNGEYKDGATEEGANTPVIFGDRSVWINCAEYEYKKEIIEEKARDKNIVILGINFIDDKMHNEKFDLATFYDELTLIFKEKVIELFKLFTGKKVHIIADHGFISQPNWHRKGEYRFIHGSDSPYEVIIPDVMLKIP